MSELVAVGLSFRTAPVAVRERASLDERASRRLLRALGAGGAVREALALSTCNRTELYAVADDRSAGERALFAALAAHTAIGSDELRSCAFAVAQQDAVTHLLRVAAGLDSMVLGESEVQGQVRAAGRLAAEEGAAGPVLDGLVRHALAAGRRVRRKTRVGAGALSVPSVAAGLTATVLGDLTRCRALLIGAGRMGHATAGALTGNGIGALELLGRDAGRARMLRELAAADVVVTSTSSAGTVLSRADVAQAVRRRAGGRLLIIDIAVPRDVDPAAGDLPGVLLRDIDDLDRLAARNREAREREAAHAEGIVAAEAERFALWRARRAQRPEEPNPPAPRPSPPSGSSSTTATSGVRHGTSSSWAIRSPAAAWNGSSPAL